MEQPHRIALVDGELIQRDAATEKIRQLGRLAAFYVTEWRPITAAYSQDWQELDRPIQDTVAHDFDEFIKIENLFESIEPGRLLSAEASGVFRSVAARFHDALPFTAPELRWLVTSHREAKQTDANRRRLPPWSKGDQLAAFIGLQSKRGEVVSVGHHQTITGGELTRRWWAWHRGVAEFEGADTYDLACALLEDLSALIGPVEVPD